MVTVRTGQRLTLRQRLRAAHAGPNAFKWQLIFKHLSCQNGLRIRSVCKVFSNLDSEGLILITTGLPSKLAIDSLILFLSRRSNFPSPGINLQLTGSVSHLKAAVHAFLPSALRCSSLLHLGLGDLLLTPLEAALGLALLPTSLLSLRIRFASCTESPLESVNCIGFPRHQDEASGARSC